MFLPPIKRSFTTFKIFLPYYGLFSSCGAGLATSLTVPLPPELADAHDS